MNARLINRACKKQSSRREGGRHPDQAGSPFIPFLILTILGTVRCKLPHKNAFLGIFLLRNHILTSAFSFTLSASLDIFFFHLSCQLFNFYYGVRQQTSYLHPLFHFHYHFTAFFFFIILLAELINFNVKYG